VPTTEETPPDHERAPVDGAAIDAAKALLRRAILLRRDVRPEAVRHADDAARFELIREKLQGRLPAVVAAYLSSVSEPGTLQLVGWLAAQDVRVLLPVLTAADGTPRRAPAWAPYAGPDALQVGVRSILEPTTAVLPDDALARADLVVCPALAANRAGDRLGRGGGWYDRALLRARAATPTWVLLNDDEVLDTIPTQPWDVPVGALVTPTRFIDRRS